MDRTVDVIIAGAGPVGLFLASELALAGVSVCVLERESTVSLWKTEPFSLRGIQVPAAEAFYRRGLLDGVIKDWGPTRPSTSARTSFDGHFAGMLLDSKKVDFSKHKYYLPGPAERGAGTSLGLVESTLSKRAQSLGVEILRGKPIERFHDTGDEVKVWSGDECFSAKWLVGCDGGRSTIRKAAGFDFAGTPDEFVGYTTVCEFDRPELLGKGFVRTASGLYLNMPPVPLFMCDFDLSAAPGKHAEPTQQHLQNVLQRVTGLDLKITSMGPSNSFIGRARQATEYRKGRVLLAGDSAHIHTPMGGQGLNLGIVDAMNLGWKLAATIRGIAAPGLLDTYHAERHPVAAEVLEWTRAQTATLRPDPFDSALANVVRALMNTPDGASFFIERIWGLSLRYDLNGTHDLVGRSAPDFEFDDGTQLGSKLQTGRFLFLNLDASDSIGSELASALPVYVDCLSLRAKNAVDLKALLIRPDGVVAWATGSSIDVDGVKAALSQWVELPASAESLHLPRQEAQTEVSLRPRVSASAA